MENCCELCGRMTGLTRHHLIPKRVHRSESIRAKFSKEVLNQRIAKLCKACHRHVHRTLKSANWRFSFTVLNYYANTPISKPSLTG
jgi:hypothetical protein